MSLNYEALANSAAYDLANDEELLEYANNMVVNRVIIEIDRDTKKIKVLTMRKDPLGIEWKGSAEADT